ISIDKFLNLVQPSMTFSEPFNWSGFMMNIQTVINDFPQMLQAIQLPASIETFLGLRQSFSDLAAAWASVQLPGMSSDPVQDITNLLIQAMPLVEATEYWDEIRPVL
ncbi:unnamed protein product, partial [Owenia fusiformis]